MKGAAIFCLNWLTEDKNGYLITAPSVSPENVFRYAENKVSDVSVATTMDMSIIWDLFTNLIDASTVLGEDKNFRNQLIAKGMIWSPNHGDTAFTVPLFDEFMKRIMPGDDWKQ